MNAITFRAMQQINLFLDNNPTCLQDYNAILNTGRHGNWYFQRNVYHDCKNIYFRKAPQTINTEIDILLKIQSLDLEV